MNLACWLAPPAKFVRHWSSQSSAWARLGDSPGRRRPFSMLMTKTEPNANVSRPRQPAGSLSHRKTAARPLALASC